MIRELRVEKNDSNYLIYNSETNELLIQSQDKTIKRIDIYEKLFSSIDVGQNSLFEVKTNLTEKNDLIFVDNLRTLLKNILEEIKKTNTKPSKD